MSERGIDISGEFPKPWTDEVVQAADVVITMGCGDACPIFPGKRYEDWVLDDPAGQDLAAVRPIRDEIERRVIHLLDDELGIPVDRTADARSAESAGSAGAESSGPSLVVRRRSRRTVSRQTPSSCAIRLRTARVR